jgi:hypothetical protein
MPFIRGNPLDTRKEWWRSLPECAKDKLHHCKGPLQKTPSLQKIGCVSSINQLNLVRKRFYSKKVTAAKKPLQWKGYRSERATAAKDTKQSENLPAWKGAKEHSSSVHSVNGPVHTRRWGAGVHSAKEPVQSRRVGLREWTGLSAEEHPPWLD